MVREKEKELSIIDAEIKRLQKKFYEINSELLKFYRWRIELLSDAESYFKQNKILCHEEEKEKVQE